MSDDGFTSDVANVASGTVDVVSGAASGNPLAIVEGAGKAVGGLTNIVRRPLQPYLSGQFRSWEGAQALTGVAQTPTTFAYNFQDSYQGVGKGWGGGGGSRMPSAAQVAEPPPSRGGGGGGSAPSVGPSPTPISSAPSFPALGGPTPIHATYSGARGFQALSGSTPALGSGSKYPGAISVGSKLVK